ncbi:transposase [Mesorhizobium sp. M1227]|uniref:IS1634 family transposase n=1 Tax=Mesorhizobium sp. M1227 TaxID=2957071 RepID=UPI003338C931
MSFYGEGGESLGQHGHSKDYRPDLKQMVLAVVIDGQGRPICTEMVAGNTADLTVLLPIVDRLRDRFKVGRVCVVADRGMISAASIAALEARKLEYFLGARERSSVIVRDLVMNDEQPFTPLLVERVKGETQLFVKQVKLSGQRYIVCRNEAEAEKIRPIARGRGGTAKAAEERRQGADRQQGLSTLFEVCHQGRLRDRFSASWPKRPAMTGSSS